MGSSETGISFINSNTEDATHNILQYEYFYNGGGVAIGDINNDGLVDIYFTSNQGENKLYLNKSGLHFEDITDRAGVAATKGWKTGVTMVDINADGLLDIYVSRSGDGPVSNRRNILYINNGDLTFADKAGSYGLDDDSYSTQAAFLDYDRDGDLDAFLLNHSRLTISNSFDVAKRNSNQRVPFVGNKLYRNDGGKFVDVSDVSGVFGPASNYGLGIAVADINADGWLDLYASNDYTGKDKLLINDEGRGFEEVSDSLLTHMSQFSMGVDIADVNNDGLDDIFSLDMLPESNRRQKELLWPNKYDVYAAMVKNGLHHQFMRNMLHLNNGDGTFSETGQLSGVSNTDWSWAALIADYDLDGRQDIFVSNGFKREFINNDFLKYKADLLLKARKGQRVDKIGDIVHKMPSNKMHNYLFRNIDGVSFKDESSAFGFEDDNLTNGAAYADLDNDGDLDLILNQIDEKAVIYRNNSIDLENRRYLAVQAIGNDANTFGLGAVVKIYSKDHTMTRTLSPTRGFQSSVDTRLFFGLDTLTIIDSLIVRWPRGETQTLKNVSTNQLVKLFQKDATRGHLVSKEHNPLMKIVPSIIPFKHKENDFVDFRIQPLLHRTYSNSGPAAVIGDVNGDKIDDLYIGGAKDQAAALLLGASGDKFVERKKSVFITDSKSEDVDAAFFDMDNDGDLDLYVVTGGFEFPPGSPSLFDHLYANDGHGNFTAHNLPGISASGSCVRPCDVDHDGDVDLFVGGRIAPGRYPEPVESMLLMNDGKGNFSKGETIVKGMVTDASWIDIDHDQWLDLVIVGEWMPVTMMLNKQGRLVDHTTDLVADKTNGWWNSLLPADFDHDGDIDFVAGNFGMNNQFKATIGRPVTIRFGDLDGNGSVDPLLQYYIMDQSYPGATRDELIDQVPVLRKRYNDYATYAQATTKSLVTDDELKRMSILTAYTLQTCYFENDQGKFSMSPLPSTVQVSPVFAMTAIDVNHDGHLDIFTGGNLHKMGARFGMATGNFGAILLGNGKGQFVGLPPTESGITIRGEVRRILVERNKVWYFRNNDTPLVYAVRESGH